MTTSTTAAAETTADTSTAADETASTGEAPGKSTGAALPTSEGTTEVEPTTGDPPAADGPQVFALMDAGDNDSLLDKFMAMGVVDGAAIRTSWQALEPAKGQFSWDVIDTALATAEKHGKHLTLHVLASGYVGPPAWIYEQGAMSYMYMAPNGKLATDPVPWDSVYLQQWSEFVTALGSHLAENDTLARVQYVSVAAPVPEMSLVGCLDGVLGGSIPYDRGAYLGAWATTVEAMQAAFPDQRKLLPVPVSQICRPDGDGPAFYGDALATALALNPDGFAHYATDLNALGSARMDGVTASVGAIPTTFQFIWSASEDPMNRLEGPLKDAVCKGLQTYDGRYFEVYKVDLESTDPALQAAVAAIHSPASCE